MESYMAQLHDDVDEYLKAFYSRPIPDMIRESYMTNCGSVDNETEGKDEIRETK